METGLFTLVSPQIDLAIAPPFPIAGDLVTPVDLDSIAAHLEVPKTVVVILLRLGSYAVGVIDNGAVAASKSGTRYVKGRHKAGGQSQRRFERNREKWIRELFDRVCVELTKRLPEDRRNVDHVALGGDRHVLDDFVKRCPALSAMSDRILDRRVPVEKPGRAAIVEAVDAIWSVTLFRGPLRPS
jgi:peptide subunit release factor 1 (eRF1)